MQFDVCKNNNPGSQERFPYLLDVQAELLSALETRVVVPLAPRQGAGRSTLTGLMPTLEIKGKPYIAVTPQMAGIPRRDLGACIGNLSHARSDIIAALDLLFTGV